MAWTLMGWYVAVVAGIVVAAQYRKIARQEGEIEAQHKAIEQLFADHVESVRHLARPILYSVGRPGKWDFEACERDRRN